PVHPRAAGRRRLAGCWPRVCSLSGMDRLPLTPVGDRFATPTGAAFTLMLLPCALQVACYLEVLPARYGDELLALSISGAAVGSVQLLRRLCEN
ncbi:MAG: hypothetical protein AB7I32_18585, partial [Gammaproteobacteria bacterium]